ncbi:DNA repair protein rhp54 [Penicillium atrosanguineum]|uniref:Uncharacterized protein n=1 Tax=Penicillium atrosanguineum TaxID=1132637 RepID=A0A9W9U1S0_9EURO|nr:DNA repair protein rhp54 [Penicillium atrosanguineum]KAJ5125319.1 hypothetical protein N7526_007496 [Penicillium atrosanguineum]KAJ5292437.1 DNA repair protein rhp54 [Penicillium atrosanguineum]KAJ5303539.1 hypothetical protein N7476_010338 [Penicillium atrosanguineum]
MKTISIILFDPLDVVSISDFNACPGSVHVVAACCDVNVEQVLCITCDEAHKAHGSSGELVLCHDLVGRS